MPLYEIVITQYKTFYVEAPSQDEALNADVVHEEQQSSFGNFDWEHDSTDAHLVDAEREKVIRQRRPQQIAKS